MRIYLDGIPGVSYLDKDKGTKIARYTGQTTDPDTRIKALKRGRTRHELISLEDGVGAKLVKYVEFVVQILYSKRNPDLMSRCLADIIPCVTDTAKVDGAECSLKNIKREYLNGMDLLKNIDLGNRKHVFGQSLHLVAMLVARELRKIDPSDHRAEDVENTEDGEETMEIKAAHRRDPQMKRAFLELSRSGKSGLAING